ncbi:MAG: hypothetical protein HHAS10_11190 [Candidatus Altimarinota bacterium]
MIASASGLLSLSQKEVVAKLLEVSSLKITKQGKDLGKLHNEIYIDFMRTLEDFLQKNSVRVSAFHGHIHRSNDGTYTLGYDIEYTRVAPGQSPHKHVELMSSVWRETKKGKLQAKSKNSEKSRSYNQKWASSFTGITIFEHESGDDDLYQVGRFYLAEKKK